jgi:hypothetical protein
MSWTEITRRQYRRDELRFASDLREAEWLILSPLLARPCHLGRPRKVDMREVVNAILYILRSAFRRARQSSTIFISGATSGSGGGSTSSMSGAPGSWRVETPFLPSA